MARYLSGRKLSVVAGHANSLGQDPRLSPERERTHTEGRGYGASAGAESAGKGKHFGGVLPNEISTKAAKNV